MKDYIYNYPLKCKIEENNLDSGSLLILDATDSDLNFRTAKLWVSEDYIINKILVSDFSDNSFLFKFNDIKLNKNLDEDLFVFNSNTNFKIIDLR